MSELALQLIKTEKEKKTGKLDISNCNLTELPEKLFDLNWLEELILSSEYYEWDDHNKEWIKRVSPNQGVPNYIVRISPKMQKLKKLKKLIIRGETYRRWNLTNIEGFANLHNLEFLDISSTQVKDLSPIGGLRNLQILDVHSTNIDSLNSLQNLENLIGLNIAANKINEIFSIGFLNNLISLEAHNTNITDILPLKTLRKLEYLSLHSTKIKNIDSLMEIKNLHNLTIANTQVSGIEALKGMEKLKFLYIHSTKVYDLKPVLHLIEKGIPIRREKYGRYQGIFVDQLSITNPPLEIIGQGREAILRYFNERKQGSKKLMEAKLLIVGQGGAGKTSLKRKLHNVNEKMPEPEDTTRGIEVTQLDCKTNSGEDFRLNIWDFGGQNVQHMRISFFSRGARCMRW